MDDEYEYVLEDDEEDSVVDYDNIEDETETVTEEPDYDNGTDIYDYAIIGVPSLVILMLCIKFCFKKFSFKISKSGIEANVDNDK